MTNSVIQHAPGAATFDYSEKVVIVTGASRGIGAAVAEAFALAGARIVLHGRDHQALEAQRDLLASQGSEAVVVAGDIREVATAESLMATAVAEYGSVDVLVNNAGGNFSTPLADLTENGWRALLETNLSGVFHCAKAVHPIFTHQGGGAIVNIGSVAGEHAHPRRAAYAAAKSAVVSLTKSMAWEWGPDIRVNCVAPGAIHTPASRFADPAQAAGTTRHIPLGRLGLPCDVADACLFLGSEAASFITGETLHVDGGPLLALPADVELVR